MELVSFSATNFRSITSAYKLPIRRPTVLIGPNNEGKSNVLRALVSALQFLSLLGRVTLRNSRVTSVRLPQDLYEWARDFPVSLQPKQPDGETLFDLEFKLDEAEVAEFRQAVGSSLNGTLPIRLSFGSREPRVQVLKQGRGGTTLTKKAELVARFVARHIHIAYIPAVRTASSAYSIVNDLVERELATIEQNDDYKKALKAVSELQKPVLDQIAESISATLKEFLPGVKGVKVTISEEARYRALRRSCEITIDDGAATALSAKGDGVQSLAALSLMKQASHSPTLKRQLILAIEEPESHLHPRAIHQLREVLSDLGKEHQVILTTHCPLFVDRTNLKSNILVNKRKAVSAKSISELRDVLGVRASDNLRNAELVLMLEGEDDRRILDAILRNESKAIAEALGSGFLVIDSLAGGTNLSYKLSQLRETLCNTYCFLDYDKAGIGAVERAQAEGLLQPQDVSFARCPGKAESEIEDLLSVSVYSQFLLNRYGTSVDSPKFKGTGKWSDRLKAAFAHQGKLWNAKTEAQIKSDVASLVEANPSKALNPHVRGPIDGLISSLEGKLTLLSNGRGDQ